MDQSGHATRMVNTMMTDSGGGVVPPPSKPYLTPDFVEYCQYHHYTFKEGYYAYYDPVHNDSPKVCEKSSFSFYNGAPVFNVHSELIDKIGLTSWSFGVIVLNNEEHSTWYDSNNFENTLRHEYGHTVQFSNLGAVSYFARVAIPSIVNNLISRNNDNLHDMYYCMPWERPADYYGKVGARGFDNPLNRELYNNPNWISFCIEYSGG